LKQVCFTTQGQFASTATLNTATTVTFRLETNQ